MPMFVLFLLLWIIQPSMSKITNHLSCKRLIQRVYSRVLAHLYMPRPLLILFLTYFRIGAVISLLMCIYTRLDFWHHCILLMRVVLQVLLLASPPLLDKEIIRTTPRFADSR